MNWKFIKSEEGVILAYVHHKVPNKKGILYDENAKPKIAWVDLEYLEALDIYNEENGTNYKLLKKLLNE